MKYLRTYEEQLNLFGQEEDKAQDVARKFAKKHTVGEFSKPGELKNYNDVLSKYDKPEEFNRFCKKCYTNWDFNESEMEIVCYDYFKDNPEVLLTYIKYYCRIKHNDAPDYITDKFNEYLKEGIAKEGDKIDDYFEKIVNDYLDSNDITDIYYLEKDGIIDSDSDFVEFITSKYSDNLAFSSLKNSEYYDDLLNVIRHCENNEIEIYRGLLIPKKLEDLDKEYSGVGISWTYDEDNARPYAGFYDETVQEIVLHGKVKIEDVNWETTFYKSVYTLSEEREIKVNSGAPIYLTEIYLKDKENTLKRLKENDYDYFRIVLNIGWKDISKIERAVDIESKEKSTIRFDEPIKIKA